MFSFSLYITRPQTNDLEIYFCFLFTIWSVQNFLFKTRTYTNFRYIVADIGGKVSVQRFRPRVKSRKKSNSVL